MSDHTPLLEPVRLGELELPNRVLMAPLTRNRAQGDGTPAALAQTYYRQRASAGLIVTEATQISAMGKGYLDTPGIHAESHVDGWSEIVRATHAGGGRIFCQLWHVGRISHVSLLPEGRQPVSSSAVQADVETFTANGFEPCSEPVALDASGIAQTLDDYRMASRQAHAAGFDGIELHAANGYLIDQFLQDGVNRREDEYGGSIQNRLRFLREALDAVAESWPAGRIGVRVSPLGQANGITDSDREALFTATYSMLSGRGLAYLHVVEQFPGSDNDPDSRALIERLRPSFSGPYIANGNYDADSGTRVIESGHADAVAYGRPFLATPDLPERIRIGADWNEPDPDTFYGGDEEGYIDYPMLDPGH